MPLITEMWAYVAEEGEGEEGIISAQMGDTHMPLVGADSARMASLLPLAPIEASDFAISAGVLEFGESEAAVEAGIELRLSQVRLLGGESWELSPAFGLMATEDRSFYGYGGFRFNFEVGDDWVVTLHTGAGLYEEGEGKNLGGTVEFRSGLEIVRLLASGRRAGLNLYHLSNAVLYDRNPGSNSLVVVFGF